MTHIPKVPSTLVWPSHVRKNTPARGYFKKNRGTFVTPLGIFQHLGPLITQPQIFQHLGPLITQPLTQARAGLRPFCQHRGGGVRVIEWAGFSVGQVGVCFCQFFPNNYLDMEWPHFQSWFTSNSCENPLHCDESFLEFLDSVLRQLVGGHQLLHICHLQ